MYVIYLWMIDKDYENVIGSTPAILGTHEVARFKGQSSPTVFRSSLDAGDIDQPLFTALRHLRHHDLLEIAGKIFFDR